MYFLRQIPEKTKQEGLCYICFSIEQLSGISSPHKTVKFFLQNINRLTGKYGKLDIYINSYFLPKP